MCVYSGCDVNSSRRPGPNGEGDEEARDGQTPLHLASSWGLEEVVQCLLEFGANVNAQVSPVTLVCQFCSNTVDSFFPSPHHSANQSCKQVLFLSICFFLYPFSVRMQRAELPYMLPLAASTTSSYSSSFPIQTFVSAFVTVKEWLPSPVPWRIRTIRQQRLSSRGSQVLLSR